MGVGPVSPIIEQPLDADLTAIAELVTTTYGRSLLTTADVDALATAIATRTAMSSRYASINSWSELLTGGEYNTLRQRSYQYATPESGRVYLQAFECRRTEPVSRMRTASGGTAAGATPTLCKLGFYRIETDGSLTLVASTANSTGLWANTWTAYTPNLQASFTKQQGQRYATACLIVSGAAMPYILGGGNNNPTVLETPPWATYQVAGQTDLPATIAVGSLTSTTRFMEIGLLT